MKEGTYQINLDPYDRRIVINALNTLRNQQIQKERPTDPVDDLIGRVVCARQRKSRPFSGRHHEER